MSITLWTTSRKKVERRLRNEDVHEYEKKYDIKKYWVCALCHNNGKACLNRDNKKLGRKKEIARKREIKGPTELIEALVKKHPECAQSFQDDKTDGSLDSPSIGEGDAELKAVVSKKDAPKLGKAYLLAGDVLTDSKLIDEETLICGHCLRCKKVLTDNEFLLEEIHFGVFLVFVWPLFVVLLLVPNAIQKVYEKWRVMASMNNRRLYEDRHGFFAEDAAENDKKKSMRILRYEMALANANKVAAGEQSLNPISLKENIETVLNSLAKDREVRKI